MVMSYKIGLDFHGVINTNPDFFREFCALLKKQKAEIHIISGGPHEIIGEFLKLHKIKYDKIWCIYDYFNARDEVKIFPDGSFHVDDYKWNAAKGEYCSEYGINLQIDDSRIYGEYFQTPYCLYDEKHRSGILNGCLIDFSTSAQNCWQQLLSALSY